MRGKSPTHDHFCGQRAGLFYRNDFERKASIVQQEPVGGLHRIEQLSEIHGNLFFAIRARRGSGCIQRYLFPFRQLDRTGQPPDPDLRPLQVLKNPHALSHFLCNTADTLDAPGVLFMCAMREIHACNVHSGQHQFFQDFFLVTGRANRRDDFCFSCHRSIQFQNLMIGK